MVLIALGVVVLVVVLGPLLFMVGMMGGSQCCGGMAWAGAAFGLLIALGAIGLIVLGLRRPL